MFGAWRSARLSYTPEFFGLPVLYHQPLRAANGVLFGLAVLAVLPVPWTKLPQHEPVRVVPLVLFGVIVALFTFGTGQRNEHPICFLRHYLKSFAM
jgi:hypothetical protein